MENSRRKKATLGIMLYGTILGFLAQTILSTAIPVMMADLEINAGSAQWLTAIYLLVLGVMIPPSAYLIRKYSTRLLVNISMIVFTVGSLIGYLFPVFFGLLLSRVLEAIGCGLLLPMVSVAVFKVLPKEKWNIAMGAVGLAICFCPVIGPTLGGILVDAFGWRSIFLVLTVLGAVIAVIGMIFTVNISENEDFPLDFASLALSILACVGIIVGISNISSFGIAHMMVWIPFIAGILCAVIFVRRQNKLEKPLLQLSVFKSKEFTLGTIMVSIVQFLSLGIVVILPIFVQNVCGYSATISGLLILPATLLMAVCSLIGGSISEKIGIKSLAVIANILLIAGMAGMIFFSKSTSLLAMGGIQLFRCAGIGLILVTVSTWSFTFVTEKIEDATAINNTLRQITAAMGSAIMAVMMTMAAGGRIDGTANSVDAFRFTCAVGTVLAIVSLVIALIIVKVHDTQSKEVQEETETDFEGPWVITIGREFGSGGHDIGKLVADKLGIAFYDHELIDLTAKENGLSVEYVAEADEKKPSELFRLLELDSVSGQMQLSKRISL